MFNTVGETLDIFEIIPAPEPEVAGVEIQTNCIRMSDTLEEFSSGLDAIRHNTMRLD